MDRLIKDSNVLQIVFTEADDILEVARVDINIQTVLPIYNGDYSIFYRNLDREADDLGHQNKDLDRDREDDLGHLDRKNDDLGHLSKDVKNIIDLVKALSFLECGKLKEVLIFIHYHPDQYIIINELDDKSPSNLITVDYDNIKFLNTLTETLIEYNMVDPLMYLVSENLTQGHNGNIPVTFTYEHFRIVCKYNHLELAKWIYSIININHALEAGFYTASEYNNEEIAKWLFSLLVIDNTYKYNLRQYFIVSCRDNNFELSKIIYNSCTVSTCATIPSDEDDLDESPGGEKPYLCSDTRNFMFICICKHGDYNMAVWFLSVYPIINIHLKEYLHFAAMGGNMDLIRLISNGNVALNDSFIEDKNLISDMIIYGSLDTLKYFYSIPNSSINLKQYFSLTCMHNKLDIAKWIYEKVNVEIGSLSIMNICNYCDSNFFQWICLENPFKLDIDAFRSIYQVKDLNNIKWLYSNVTYGFKIDDWSFLTLLSSTISTLGVNKLNNFLNVAKWTYSLIYPKPIKDRDIKYIMSNWKRFNSDILKWLYYVFGERIYLSIDHETNENIKDKMYSNNI